MVFQCGRCFNTLIRVDFSCRILRFGQSHFLSKALEDVRRIEKLAKHLLVKKLTIVLNKPRTALLARFEKRANVVMIYDPLRASLDVSLALQVFPWNNFGL